MVSFKASVPVTDTAPTGAPIAAAPQSRIGAQAGTPGTPHVVAFLGEDRFIAYLLLALAVGFNVAQIYPEVAIKVPAWNDGVMHLPALARTVAALTSGQDPTDPWLAGFSLGYPLFHYYQHLPYLIPAAFSVLYTAIFKQSLNLSDVLSWSTYLLLCMFPVSIYWSMRRFGFPRLPSGLAGLLAPLIATHGLFGFELNSYLWDGFGLYTQAWGMLLLPPALAQSYAVLRDGRGYFWAALLMAATVLAHLAFGYIALGSLVLFALLIVSRRTVVRVVTRLALLLVPVAAATSYFLFPLMLDSAYLNRSVWDAQWKYDSFGHAWVLGTLAQGDLFDAGRFPSLTLLAAVGLATCVWRCRDVRYRVPVGLFVLWLLLFFGRPTWGSLLDITPLSRDLYFHRLIAGVHLGGIFLIGIGLAVPWTWAHTRRNRRYMLGPAVLTALLLFPVYGERASYLADNARVMAANRTAYAAEERDVSGLIDWLREAPPGRVFAGPAGGWGKDYRVGDMTMYALLTRAGLDNISFLYYLWSLNGDVEVLFDERRPEQYNLFDIRYVVAPRDRPMPDFLTPVRNFGRHRVYQVQTNGYFDLVGTSTTFVGGKSDFYPPAARWLASDEPRAKEHPTLVFGASSPDFQTSFPLAQAEALIPRNPLLPEPPRGEVLEERVESNAYTARIDVLRDSLLLLKTTYHPNWHAVVDGLETPTVMLMPSYLGVPVAPGPHLVRLEYRPQPLRHVLMLLGLLALLLTAVAEWRPRPLARLFERLNWQPATALAMRLNRGLVAPFVAQAVAAAPTVGARGDQPGSALSRLAGPAAAHVARQVARVRINTRLAFLGGVALAALLSGLPLLQQKLMSGHDRFEYLPRDVEFFRALTTGQLVPRWAPEFGAGHGEPFFSFNPPVFYYLSAVFHALGSTFIAAEDLACLVLLLVAGLGMYVLASDFFGRHGGLVAAVAYVFAPYLHSRLYVSHALADFSAFAFLPFAVWGLHRWTEGGHYRFLVVAAVAAAFVQLSSNPVALMSFPTLVLLVAWLAWARRSLAILVRGTWCLALGLGLSAFFWLPALMERDNVHVHRLLEGFLNYHNHFAYFYQLIYSPWGYGDSNIGPGDGMSFAIGPVHLALAVAALLLLGRIRALSGRAALMVSFALVTVAFGAFLSIYESTFVWDRLPLLQYLEYPWRFLTLVAPSTAFLAGFPFLLVPPGARWRANGVLAALIGLVLLVNFAHARPERFLDDITDAHYTPQNIAARYLVATTAGEYEPVWVQDRPAPAAEPVTVLTGQAHIAIVRRSPTELEFRADTVDEAQLRINTFYFPGWRLYVDGDERAIDRSNPQGLMELSLPPGVHQARVSFGDTPVRTWSACLSLLALLALLLTPWLVTRARRLGVTSSASLGTPNRSD
jgi:hypothetical protein